MWYGLKIGLTYQQTWSIPFGELSDLVSIEQLKHEGAKLKETEEDAFFRLLERR